jgi:(p)ppGpp synthase/HD superfamily hydrolase
MQSQSGDSVEFLEHLKVDFPRRVYVFTPRAEYLSLPRGATAVDFAYAVHTYLIRSLNPTQDQHNEKLLRVKNLNRPHVHCTNAEPSARQAS